MIRLAAARIGRFVSSYTPATLVPSGGYLRTLPRDLCSTLAARHQQLLRSRGRHLHGSTSRRHAPRSGLDPATGLSRSSGAARIVSVWKEDDALLVSWQGDRESRHDGEPLTSRYHYVWLRDNCLCSDCYHPATHQRLLDTSRIQLDVSPTHLEVTEEKEKVRGKKLNIKWTDGHSSHYPLSWLMENRYDHHTTHPLLSPCEGTPELWDSSISSHPPSVEYQKVMSDEREVFRLLSTIERHGFCFVEGTPPDEQSTQRLLEKAGVIRHTLYGGFWTFSDQQSQDDVAGAADTAYSNLAIDLHTDCNYFSEAPGIQSFHCLKFEGTGGLSTLVDGFKVAEKIRCDNPHLFRVLSSVALPYHYTDPGCHSYFNYFIPFTLDENRKDVVRVNFNNSDRLPLDSKTIRSVEKLGLTINSSPIRILYNALRIIMETSRDESLVYLFRLELGRVLVFNNHRVLHARTAFTGTRVLCGCYINREDFLSQLRVLGKKYTPSEGPVS